MIKCNKGKIHIEGTAVIICAELSALVNELKSVFSTKFDSEEAEELIMLAVARGLKDVEEIKAESEERKEELADLFGMLADVLRGKEDKEDGSEQ